MEHHYRYGSGMIGCLYDGDGPEFCSDIEDAIDSLVWRFEDYLSENSSETDEMTENLRTNGIHYFGNPSEAGADYCEISKMNGPCPEESDES